MIRRVLERALVRRWHSDTATPVLAALSPVYRRLARSGWTRPAAVPPCPVVVVGNLTVGGSGKTPVVAALARLLAGQGFRPGIISRGYPAPRAGVPLRVRPESDPEQVGDEPRELAAATGQPVWVCRRRRHALDAALAAGCDVVISDDGLQHRDLPRSFEICVVDGRRGFGNSRLLPAGPLRQPVERLDTVDLVLCKGPKLRDPALPGTVLEVGYGELEPADGRPTPPDAIDAVAGIADPQPFFDELARRGFRVRAHAPGDHARISRRWLAALPGPVVMTGKDRMRLTDPRRDDLFVLPVSVALPADAARQVLAHVREFGS